MAAPSSDWLRHFWLLLWNRWTEFNKTWQETRSQCALLKVCDFRADRKTKMAAPPLIGRDIFYFSSEIAEQNSTKLERKQDLNVLHSIKFVFFGPIEKNKMATPSSDWLRHFWLLLWNHWREFYETWQEARSQCALPSLCFSGRSENQDGRPRLWLAETFLTSSLKPLNGIQQNLTGKKISMSSTKFVFFGPIGKVRWPPWPLIRWDELEDTCQEARSQGPLPSLCFSGRSKKQDGRLGLWFAKTFLTSALKRLKGISWNLTGSKISTSSTKFVFFRLIGKTRWPPWPLVVGDTYITTLCYIVAQQIKTTHWLNNI